jgi:hypothetical protein
MQTSLKALLVHNKNKFIALICALIGISTLQIAAVFVGPGLDASGLIAILWIGTHHLQIGTDIIYQYGPLGYLYLQTFGEPSLWIQALSYNLFIHFFFIFSTALLVIKLRVNWKDQILVFSLLLILSNVITSVVKIDPQETFSITIIIYLIAVGKIGNKYASPILSFLALLLAIESFVINDLVVVSVSIIMAYSLISIVKKEFRKPLIFTSSYIFCLVILWIILGQHIDNFPAYFTNIFSSSSGYSYAMAIDGPAIYLISGLVAICFLVILFIYSLIKKFHNLIIFMLLNVILLFVEFKHGFIRQDNHVIQFYFVYGAFFISSYLIFKHDTPQASRDKKRFVLLTILIIGSILLVVSIDIVDSKLIVPKVSNLRSYGEVFPLTFDKSYEAIRMSNYIAYQKSFINLDEYTIQHIGNKTMDIVPWDHIIPFLYDFNWSPSPMPWPFEVYTPYIDSFNAQHFLGKKAPQEILYSYKSIDGRYPLYDEPATFAAILENYQYIHTSNGSALLSSGPLVTNGGIEAYLDPSYAYALLSHSPRQDIGENESLGTAEVDIGKPIKIPKYDKGYVFANIDLRFSSIGKFMNAIYKPSQAHIIFKFSDSTHSKEFRFIPGSSNDGVFVSQYVDNIHDLESIFSGKLAPNIDEIIVLVDNPADYEKNIQVNFVGVPASVSIQESGENKIPDWGSLKLIQGGSMSIDFVGNKLYSQEKNVLNINKAEQQFIPINGWAVDGLSRDGTVKTFLVFHGGGREIVLPTHKVLRPDVAKFFGVTSYQYSGWSTALDTEEFENGCYTLSLRIPTSTGQEYFEVNGSKPICFN